MLCTLQHSLQRTGRARGQACISITAIKQLHWETNSNNPPLQVRHQSIACLPPSQPNTASHRNTSRDTVFNTHRPLMRSVSAKRDPLTDLYIIYNGHSQNLRSDTSWRGWFPSSNSFYLNQMGEKTQYKNLTFQHVTTILSKISTLYFCSQSQNLLAPLGTWQTFPHFTL